MTSLGSERWMLTAAMSFAAARRLIPEQEVKMVAAITAPDACRLSAVSTTDAALELDLEAYRRELTGYCYRMLGSSFEAEDAVQETLLRAWKAIDTFEGRSAVRSWLYRIATNVCLDMLRGRQRRARPLEIGPSATTDNFTAEKLPENVWVSPIPDRAMH